jgi:hypothetical protein
MLNRRDKRTFRARRVLIAAEIFAKLRYNRLGTSAVVTGGRYLLGLQPRMMMACRGIHFDWLRAAIGFERYPNHFWKRQQ